MYVCSTNESGECVITSLKCKELRAERMDINRKHKYQEKIEIRPYAFQNIFIGKIFLMKVESKELELAHFLTAT